MACSAVIIYQINYYINGIKPFLVEQVVIGNTDTLNNTITLAKLVELGVNTSPLTTTIPATISITEPIQTSTTTTTVKPTLQVDEMEALTKQMQQLALNHQNNQAPTQNSFNPNITCFKCGNDEYEEEWEEEDEYEAYVTTRSRSVPYEISSPRGKRTRFSEFQKED
ncbi:hypothetical protein C1646_752602 [Rhizophagus diaphanus]|nr:hypothetical protein C1646_752602 [Rhizophagus diaphanus] [Rhizophagus sp. MUCL 43196]